MNNYEKTAYMIAVLNHFLDGGAIEYKERDTISKDDQEWRLTSSPIWNWSKFDYRIADIKPSIDWSQILLDYKWLAVNMDGRGFVFIDKPDVYEFSELWDIETLDLGGICEVTALVSFDPGNCDCQHSLVERPE